MASFAGQPVPSVIVTSDRSSSRDSSALKSPRTARFAEATSVCSPVEASTNPFADPPLVTNHYMPQPQVSDIGFGYLNEQPKHLSVEIDEVDEHNRYLPPPTPRSPLKSPLKSALKSPGAPPRNFDALKSPTFQEEEILDKAEVDTEKVQADDFKVKSRVRMAKFFLRGVNFSCSLIVLSMLATTFSIFNATKALPARNNLPPWAVGTQTWPQITLLAISCVSLFMCMVIFWGYTRGGHRKAEKVAVYYTSFAVLFFVFSIVMWGVGAAVLNQSRVNGNGQDIWGWSCKDNKRRALFESDVSYALVCRLQNWSLVCCIIEVVVEVLTIAVYGIIFYRYYSKRKLRKSMATRDRARSDMYLAQLRSQSAPNTPGFGPMSPSLGGWRPPPGHPRAKPTPLKTNVSDDSIAELVDEKTQYATVPSTKITAQPTPLKLAAPPLKTPKTPVSAGASPTSPFALGLPPKSRQAAAFAAATTTTRSTTPSQAPPATKEIVNEHAHVADGEVQYGAVAIPGAYLKPATTTAEPLNSPGFAPTHRNSSANFNFGLDSRVRQ